MCYSPRSCLARSGNAPPWAFCRTLYCLSPTCSISNLSRLHTRLPLKAIMMFTRAAYDKLRCVQGKSCPSRAIYPEHLCKVDSCDRTDNHATSFLETLSCPHHAPCIATMNGTTRAVFGLLDQIGDNGCPLLLRERRHLMSWLVAS